MYAWNATRKFAGHDQSGPPLDSLVWGLAAMKHCTSHVHIDSNGTATAIDTLAGKKLWVVLRPKTGVKTMRSIHALGPNWDTEGDGGDDFEFEAVVLKPGIFL
jgi:hypothetical protein